MFLLGIMNPSLLILVWALAGDKGLSVRMGVTRNATVLIKVKDDDNFMVVWIEFWVF